MADPDDADDGLNIVLFPAKLPALVPAVFKHTVANAIPDSMTAEYDDELVVDSHILSTDPLYRPILAATWEARAEAVAQREHNQSIPFGEREPLLRTSADMQVFELQRRSYFLRKQGIRSKVRHQLEGQCGEDDLLFLPEYQLMSSVPAITSAPSPVKAPVNALTDHSTSESAFLFTRISEKRLQCVITRHSTD